MEIAFAGKRMEKTCNESVSMVREYGPECAKKLKLRLTQLSAAVTLEDLRNASGRCHELTGNRSHQLSLDLQGPYRLIFEPADHEGTAKDDGGIDWSLVHAVVIIEVVDTHD